MDTPICDFVKRYSTSNIARVHMPGHKGKGLLGFENYDITEVDGADALYHANGIIKKSEENASSLFESGKTLYSTEGSSQCIRAMLHLARMHAVSQGKKDKLYALATKNAHSSFISSAILSDFDVTWLSSDENSYLSGKVSPQKIENVLSCVDVLPFAVYVTSPDYLGNICDIKGIAEVCKKYNVPLLVDNAHGAYLKFLEKSEHPLDLGATMCCDSAHKTLPVLTGGAYLHISKDAPAFFRENAKSALMLFGSSSPSYLTLCSLDNAIKYINDGFEKKLSKFITKVDNLKQVLTDAGYSLLGNEKLKITIDTKKYGYLGSEVYNILYKKGVVCEFYDPDCIVMMLSPENGENDLGVVKNALLSIPRKTEILDTPPTISPCKRALSPRNAHFKSKEIINIENAEGRVLADLNVSCPPCVSVISCGECFNRSAIQLCKYYGIDKCCVVKE